MTKTHKKQHTVPRSYLSSWIEPVTPPGQTSAIRLISKADRSVRRKSPAKTFTETDRYTVFLKDGARDLTVENYLGGIESDFQGVLRALRNNQRLTIDQRAKLAAFTAAMLGRSKRKGDWMLHQRKQHVEKIREMEQAINASPNASQELEATLLNYHADLVVQMIRVAAPILFNMRLTICTTEDPMGFITSDAPAVMYNPRSYTFPPHYRSPGLYQKYIEVTLPLTPRHLALFTHTFEGGAYYALPERATNEINRTILFFAEKEIVSKTGGVKDFWFSEREKPSDAWDPMSVPQVRTEGLDMVKEIVAKFENAKEFHDQWREEIFLEAPKVE
jgi:hypothetical protein